MFSFNHPASLNGQLYTTYVILIMPQANKSLDTGSDLKREGKEFTKMTF